MWPATPLPSEVPNACDRAPSLEELAKYPTMTRWFRQGLLAKLLWRVIVAELFGQYANRRLIVAALDTVSDDELVERAQQFAPGSGNDDCTLTPDPEGAIWIDYVADLSDGFDATYAIASSGWWNLNHNDAFSAMRLDSHRNFLRLRIKDDAVMIYPIGLDCVPWRNAWRRNAERRGSPTTGLCSGVPAGAATDRRTDHGRVGLTPRPWAVTAMRNNIRVLFFCIPSQAAIIRLTCRTEPAPQPPRGHSARQ